MDKKKVLRGTGIVLLILTLIAVLFLGGLCIYHQSELKKEREAIHHLVGQYVEVNGKNMNLYVDGTGEQTMIFLPGSMTPSPILDFKPLYTRLTDKYKVVVIEKFGYGYSDEYDGDRSVDVITEQDRKALESLDITGPYILVPHSASGLEAVYWANTYPEEIEAIIGLDPAVPEQYDYTPGPHITEMEPQDIDDAVRAMAVSDFFNYRIGLMRLFMNPDEMSAALRSDALSEEEKEQYRALFYTKFCAGSGSTMMRETICDEHALDVLLKIYHCQIPDVPTLFFVSNDEAMLANAYGSIDNWHRIHKNYISEVTDGEIVYLDCGHYVHAEKPDEVSHAMRAFIESLDRREK